MNAHNRCINIPIPEEGEIKLSDANGFPDKNLSNVVEDLAKDPVNSHQAQQQQQQTNDRRHQDALNHDKTTDQEHLKS